jgi:hypothetical protein
MAATVRASNKSPSAARLAAATPIPDGTKLIALATVALWQRWEGSKAVDPIVRKPGEYLPAREKLGHMDETESSQLRPQLLRVLLGDTEIHVLQLAFGVVVGRPHSKLYIRLVLAFPTGHDRPRRIGVGGGASLPALVTTAPTRSTASRRASRYRWL